MPHFEIWSYSDTEVFFVGYSDIAPRGVELPPTEGLAYIEIENKQATGRVILIRKEPNEAQKS